MKVENIGSNQLVPDPLRHEYKQTKWIYFLFNWFLHVEIHWVLVGPGWIKNAQTWLKSHKVLWSHDLWKYYEWETDFKIVDKPWIVTDMLINRSLQYMLAMQLQLMV